MNLIFLVVSAVSVNYKSHYKNTIGKFNSHVSMTNDEYYYLIIICSNLFV